MQPAAANAQRNSEAASAPTEGAHGSAAGTPTQSPSLGATTVTARTAKPTRFYGTVALDPTRAGRDAGRIADEVIAHLAGLIGAKVTVCTMEIEAHIPQGAPDNVVRTVTENSRTLKFSTQGFEQQ